MPLTDDLRTNLLGSTDMDGTSEPANSEHHQQHNLANAYSKAAESAHGTTAHILQTIYDNGTAPGDSEITVNDTNDGIVIIDASTPITPTSLLKVTTDGGTVLFGVSSDGLEGSQNLALTGGLSSAAAGANSERYGAGATAAGADGLAVGKGATASGAQATAIGVSTTATAIGATALGQSADATADASTALGKNAQAIAAASTSVGEDASASASNATAVGKGSAASGVSGSAYGSLSSATGGQDVAFGFQASTTQLGGVAIGRNATAPVTTAESDGIAIGNAANASGSASVAIGSGATTTGASGINIGGSGSASAADTTAIGSVAVASAAQAIAIGDNCEATGIDSIAFGGDSSSTHSRATVIGQGSASTANDQVVLGAAADGVVVPGTLAVTGVSTLTGATNIAADLTVSPGDIAAVNATKVVSTIENSTASDASGARSGLFEFFGRTAAAALHTLANMEANHSGSASDQRGLFTLRVNDGGDGTTPTDRMTVDYNGGVVHVIDTGALFKLERATGASANFDIDALTGDKTVTMPNRPITLGAGASVQGSITSLASAQTNVAMVGSTADGMTMPYKGRVVFLSGASDGLAALGHSCTMTVWKNGVSGADSVTVDNTGQEDSTTGSITFVAGDRLQVKATSNGSWTTRSVDAMIFTSQD